jgi:arabinan endo-1,5-alpha-L-arabinosidase
MNRATYLIAALTIVLVAGILLVITLSLQKSPPETVREPYTNAVPPTPPPAAPNPRPAFGSAASPGTPSARATVAAPVPRLPLEPRAHDPVMIKEGDYYYVFYTGGLINALRSKDLVTWVPSPRTLPGIPDWVRSEWPNNRADLWAPDIAYFNGNYLLYYSASTFGSRNSGIGLATNKTLDPASRNYAWRDAGMIVRTHDSDDFNAIDPNFALDERGQPWLAFGSWWSGIKLIRLNQEGKPDPNDKTVYSLAARKPPETAIEAPFIIREGRYFYLFVSWDKCCQGVRSTYRIMTGRAEKITGPYLDKDGVDLAKGGGTQLLAGDGQRLRGPGHEGLFKDGGGGGRWLMVHHFYDGNTPQGLSRLQVRPVTFDNAGWPALGKALDSPG